MTRHLIALAALALAVPVQANAVDAGRECGVTATGLVNNHLGTETGVIYGGPWAVVDGTDVTVTCQLEYSNASCYGTSSEFVTITSDPRPVGVLTPVPLTFWNPYQVPIYLGTTITWRNADGSVGVHDVDFDASKPGAQCAVYTWGNEA